MEHASSYQPNLTRHLPALDGIRGIAIVTVMLHHMTVMVPKNAFDTFVANVLHLGRTGVDLFFVLSGFLITGILFDAKGSEGYFRNFYARRVLRIFPLYYALVVFSLVLLPHFPHPKVANFARISGDEIWYWLLASNIIMAIRAQARHGILDVTWSLAIEEQFYLVWPWVMSRLNRIALMRLCVGLVVTAILVRTALYAARVHWFTIYTLTPCRMDGLAVGAFLALAARGPGGLGRMTAPARKVFWLSAAGLAVMYAVEGMGDETAGPISQSVGYSLLVVFYGALLVLAVAADPKRGLGRVVNAKPLVFFGLYSYGLYLFHLPLRALVRDMFYSPARFATLAGSQLPGQVAFFALSTAISVVVALASFHLFEKHFLSLKRHFEKKSPPPLSVSTASTRAPLDT